MYSSREECGCALARLALIQKDIRGDAEQPGGKRSIAPETADGIEDAQKSILRDIIGVVIIAGQPVREVVNLLLVLADKLIEGRQIAALAAFNQRLFFRRDRRPAPRMARVHRVIHSLSSAFYSLARSWKSA